MTLLIQQAKFELYQKQTLNLPHFAIEPQQYWVVVGGNGSGKSAFALALQNELPLQEGVYHNSFKRVHSFSFEKQREILEATLKNLNNDDTDPDFFGKTARETILNGSTELAFCEQIAEKLGITYLLDRFFIKLSTGETRKVLLAQALLQKPDLLILDEPFANVDKKTRNSLLALLKDLNNHGVTIIVCDHEHHLYLNYADTFTYLSDGNLELVTDPTSKNPNVKLCNNTQSEQILRLENISIQQGKKELLNVDDFHIFKGITTLTGDNGTGKTTLLHAISQLKKYDGKIYFNEEKVKKSRKLYKKISTCLQDAFQQFISLMPREEISMQKDIWEHAPLWQERLLKEFDLEKELDKSLYYYSGGQRKLIQLMCLLSQKTELLLLDEPFTHLDERACSFIMEWIEENKRLAGQSFIIVSHRLEPLNNRSDYHIEISNNTLHYIKEDYYGKENN